MRTTVLGTGLVTLLALGSLAACGGNVVVDGGSGGAGAGYSTSTGRTTNATSVVSSGTGGSDAKPLCEAVCEVRSSRCMEPDCLEDCLQAASKNPECNAQLVALLQCVQSNLDSCDRPMRCEQASNEYRRCVDSGDCGTVECFGSSDGSCGCKGTCRGLDLGVECSARGMTSACNCFRDGQLVGTCEDVGSECRIEGGCCSSFFFPER